MTKEDKQKNELLSGVDIILKKSGVFEDIPDKDRIIGVAKPIVEFVYNYCKRNLK